jgi:hypothetical protein
MNHAIREIAMIQASSSTVASKILAVIHEVHAKAVVEVEHAGDAVEAEPVEVNSSSQ